MYKYFLVSKHFHDILFYDQVHASKRESFHMWQKQPCSPNIPFGLLHLSVPFQLGGAGDNSNE